MTADSVSHYEVLGVSKTATTEEIRKAYRKFSRAAHPDTGGNAGLFRMVTIAYETLSDPQSRASYDLSLGIKPEPTPTSPSASSTNFRPNPEPSSQTYTPKEEPKPGPQKTNNSNARSETNQSGEDTWFWPKASYSLGSYYSEYYQKYKVPYSTMRTIRVTDRVLTVLFFVAALSGIVWADVEANSWIADIFLDLLLLLSTFGALVAGYALVVTGRFLLLNIFYGRRKF